jgi:hypothetical protein
MIDPLLQSKHSRTHATQRYTAASHDATRTPPSLSKARSYQHTATQQRHTTPPGRHQAWTKLVRTGGYDGLTSSMGDATAVTRRRRRCCHQLQADGQIRQGLCRPSSTPCVWDPQHCDNSSTVCVCVCVCNTYDCEYSHDKTTFQPALVRPHQFPTRALGTRKSKPDAKPHGKARAFDTKPKGKAKRLRPTRRKPSQTCLTATILARITNLGESQS